MLTTNDIINAYGTPGDPDNLVSLNVPYQLRIAWDSSKTTNKVTVHKKVGPRLQLVFADLLAHYGQARIKELGIDLYGGIYNFRPQRGLEKRYAAAIKAKNYPLAYSCLSRHAWAIAIDLDPARNDLKTKAPKAQFSRPEYGAMNDIFYRHGFIGYGRERGNDWMHYEIGIKL